MTADAPKLDLRAFVTFRGIRGRALKARMLKHATISLGRGVTHGSRGLGIVGLMAVTPVFLVGWLGILIVGLAICFCAAQAELDDQAPVASDALLRRQFEQSSERTAEERLADWAQRVEHNKGLYIVTTVGIAAILIGLNMFIVHQL